MKAEFLKDFNEEYAKWIKEWYLDRGMDIPLHDLYGVYYDTYIEKIGANIKLKDLTDPQNREKFLIYLSRLLRTGELKMKTFEHYKKEHPQGKDGYVINTITPGREWKQEEIEEGINYVREKWNSFDNSRERKLGILGCSVYPPRKRMDDVISSVGNIFSHFLFS